MAHGSASATGGQLLEELRRDLADVDGRFARPAFWPDSKPGWLGMGPEDLLSYEPRAGAQAYPAFVAWLALNGSRADVALAFLANLAAWGTNCGRVAAALRDRYSAEEEAVAFFDFFATPPPGFEEPARSTPARGYELLFWDTLAEGDT